ncbi:MAG: carboxypeptidase-like regulatory domain-containing protein [Candidatus Acidiferrales bacterium]
MNRRRMITPLLCALLCVLAASVQAQDKKSEAKLRTVHGFVVDKSENPVPSSVVYLKNLHTNAVKTYITDDAGTYRFSGLDPNEDYEIHAELGDLASSPRQISRFDDRKDIEIPLKLVHHK